MKKVSMKHIISPHPKYVAEKHADTISQKKCRMWSNALGAWSKEDYMQDLIIYFGVGIASAGTVVGLIAFCLHRKKKNSSFLYRVF